MPFPHATALQNTCVLTTPNERLNAAFRYAKDNIARTMRYYTRGWGMSNAPHAWCIVVGRDTGWMCVGTDYAAGWFAPEALGVFCDRQKANGQIMEYIDLESGFEEDYGLNVADNTPLVLWAVCHHWQQYQEEAFRQRFLPAVVRAGDHLLGEIGTNGLLNGIPVGVATNGTTSWRNVIPERVMAGESTEINSETVMALRMAAEFTGEPRFTEGAERIAEAINTHLWNGDGYLLNRTDGKPDPQVTGDAVFPVLCGVAPPERARLVLDRLAQPDFWTPRGLRTIPSTDAEYHPRNGYGLVGGSWPNLTLWYAAAVAPYDADRALSALEMVALPVVEELPESVNVRPAEFAEFFDGETQANMGMPLSPWIAPTFLWATLEGLLGLTWEAGKPVFHPHWPADWQEITLTRLPTAAGFTDVTLKRE